MRKKREALTWRILLCAAFFTLHSSLFISCSEEDATEDEYVNWQERNETFFATLQDSLTRGSGTWLRLKSFSLDQTTEGLLTDYIYAKILVQSAVQTESPKFTDSVRVSYEGRILPTTTYPEGYIFDTTMYNDYNIATASTVKLLTSNTVAGFSTALQHMHRGDRWRVYIPHQLAYGSTPKTGIPAYSTLIFDLTLVDFSAAGETMAPWK
ncbi:MAG: FKBP-type peptidyl-prolyl cis-trans isomerase [Prevotella sp.]|nr:FKBP-type peptidyl-prolyl cis-trans isomerase [Prevotella sp.]